MGVGPERWAVPIVNRGAVQRSRGPRTASAPSQLAFPVCPSGPEGPPAGVRYRHRRRWLRSPGCGRRWPGNDSPATPSRAPSVAGSVLTLGAAGAFAR